MKYSRTGATQETVQLSSDVHQYVIETTEPFEYTVDVAAATRQGPGPTRSQTGEIFVRFLSSSS